MGVSNSSHLKETWRWWPADQRLEKPEAPSGPSGNPGWAEQVNESHLCAPKDPKLEPMWCSVIDFVWSKKWKTRLEPGWDHFTRFKYSFTCFWIESGDFFCLFICFGLVFFATDGSILQLQHGIAWPVTMFQTCWFAFETSDTRPSVWQIFFFYFGIWLLNQCETSDNWRGVEMWSSCSWAE